METWLKLDIMNCFDKKFIVIKQENIVPRVIVYTPGVNYKEKSTGKDCGSFLYLQDVKDWKLFELEK